MGEKRVREYVADEIVVGFESSRCIHAARCVNGLPAVFDTDRKPWIDPGAAPAERIAEQVALCPTGALTARTPDGAPIERTEAEFSISEVADGPLYVRGRFSLVDDDGTPFDVERRVALCRCGASETKPFCDGSHTEVGFTA